MDLKLRQQALEKFIQEPLINLAEQGTDPKRFGGKHRWTAQVGGDMFIKAIDSKAPFSARRPEDHAIQNILADLEEKGILKLGFRFPKTLLILKNVGLDRIKELEEIQKNLQLKLESLKDKDEVFLDEQGIDLKIVLPNKINQLERNLRIIKGIEAQLYPHNENEKIIAFVMEDIEKFEEKGTTPSLSSQLAEQAIETLNEWLEKYLGVYRQDSGIVNMRHRGKDLYLFDPTFRKSVFTNETDPSFRQKHKMLLENHSPKQDWS